MLIVCSPWCSCNIGQNWWISLQFHHAILDGSQWREFSVRHYNRIWWILSVKRSIGCISVTSVFCKALYQSWVNLICLIDYGLCETRIHWTNLNCVFCETSRNIGRMWSIISLQDLVALDEFDLQITLCKTLRSLGPLWRTRSGCETCTALKAIVDLYRLLKSVALVCETRGVVGESDDCSLWHTTTWSAGWKWWICSLFLCPRAWCVRQDRKVG